MSEQINNIFDNVLITMPYTVYLSTILVSIVSNNYNYLYFFLYVLLLGDGMNYILKSFFKNNKLLPKNWCNTLKRPSGCAKKVGNFCRGCGIYPSYNNKIGSTTSGFPSGHSHIMSLTMTFWTIYIINSNEKLEIKQYTSIILLWILYLLICFQRVKSRCHNIYQIIGGAIFGIPLGILGYYICNKLSSKTFPYKN